MGELQKAKLQEVSSDANESPVGEAVPVQFNPTSLKLKLSNKVEGGRSRGRQRRQHNGSSSTVLSMDLVFDSADEGSDESPVSVRTKTGIVEKYVVPKTDGSETPPRLRFEWNDLIVSGIVESVDIDFDHFATNGTPLRAKVSLSIKEQEAKYQYLEAGPGARDASQASTPGGGAGGASPGGGTNSPAPGGGGGPGANNSDRSAPALEGESPPEFAARQGLDPAAWRGLDVDLSAGLSLEAGVEIGFSAGLSIGAGVGLAAGFQADIGVSVEAAIGLDASANLNTSVGGIAGADAAGFALAAAGGVGAAIETVKINQSQTAVNSTVESFGLSANITTPASAQSPGAVSGQGITAGEQKRVPLSVSGTRSHTAQTRAAPAPLPAKADPRASSFGLGVPLRPQYETALLQEQVRVCNLDRSAIRKDGGPRFRKDPTTAPWEALPQRDTTREKVDALEQKKRINPCNYISGCDC